MIAPTEAGLAEFTEALRTYRDAVYADGHHGEHASSEAAYDAHATLVRLYEEALRPESNAMTHHSECWRQRGHHECAIRVAEEAVKDGMRPSVEELREVVDAPLTPLEGQALLWLLSNGTEGDGDEMDDAAVAALMAKVRRAASRRATTGEPIDG